MDVARHFKYDFYHILVPNKQSRYVLSCDKPDTMSCNTDRDQGGTGSLRGDSPSSSYSQPAVIVREREKCFI